MQNFKYFQLTSDILMKWYFHGSKQEITSKSEEEEFFFKFIRGTNVTRKKDNRECKDYRDHLFHDWTQ